MAVQVLIHRSNGKVVFDPPANLQQSDIVFWRNDDTEAHFPVPGCGSLKVAPGQSTASAPYQPFPDTTPNLPLPIDYVCALHQNESGTMTVIVDQPGGPLAGPPGIDNAAVPIHIKRSGGKVTFDTVDVAQGDTVFWMNDDSEEHWPVPHCSGLLVQPGKSSTELQPATFNFPRSGNIGAPYGGPAPLPAAITYGCAIPGHEKESGTINVYDNLAAVPTASQTPVTQQGIPIQVVTGGKSPYTIVQDPSQPTLTQMEMIPPGSSSGIGVVLNGPVPKGQIPLRVDITDALGKHFNQTITVPGGSNS